MRFGGVSVILVLLALLLAAHLYTAPAWGACHTTHASFYYYTGDENKYLGRRSVEATYDWQRMGCVPYKCRTDDFDEEYGNWCQAAIKRYGCPWWGKGRKDIFIEYAVGTWGTLKSQPYTCNK